MIGLMAKKIGMTQVFDDEGNMIPVTVLRIDQNIVIAKKTEEKDGYNAVLLGQGEMKKNRVTKPYAGQFAEDIAPTKRLKEFRNFEVECKVGDSLGIELFSDVRYVDVAAISKGKGFQGVVKRYGFGGGRATHGSKFHREPGSTGQCTAPGRTFRNTKLPGRMGREKVTVLNLKVVKVDVESRTILVRGAVPGVNQGSVVIRCAVKK